MTDTAKNPPLRSTYRHGDLRRALLDAGIALARAGGPEAVVLRAATRQAGVVPNAAYRHFASQLELLQAVQAHALSAIAMAMERELARLGEGLTAAEQARASVRAVGNGYLRFACAEPGLFRTAFSPPSAIESKPDPAKAGKSGMNPFQLLGLALDRMSAAGLMPAERRPGAEYLAWSAVHGWALLCIDGPLRQLPVRQREMVGQRLLDMVEKGIV